MYRVLLLVSVTVISIAFSAIPSIELFNAAVPGTKMPVTGLGTGGYGGPVDPGEWWNDTVSEVAVKEWIRFGGRRIDTSLLYYTQKGVGKAWKASGVPREELFITSKCDLPGVVHNGSGAGGMYPGGYNYTIQSIKVTLEQLQTDYVDLMLIHWPGTPEPITDNIPPCWSKPNNWVKCRRETWRALGDALKDGKLKAIGVSNFEVNHIEEIMNSSELVPSVNQFEFHPYTQTHDLEEFCRKHKIAMNGYAPLTTPDFMAFHKDRMPITVIDNQVVKDIAKKYNTKTPAQIVQRWELDRGFVLNPRTEKPEHMKENLDIFDFKLSTEDTKSLFALQNGERVCPDPHLIP